MSEGESKTSPEDKKNKKKLSQNPLTNTTKCGIIIVQKRETQTSLK
jgi:hypothetical protein